MPKGVCLMEVFGIIYLGHKELKPDDQIGTIKVNDGYARTYPIYTVKTKDKATTPSVCYGDELILKGPKWSFSGEETFRIEVDLFNGAYRDTIYFEWDDRSEFSYHKQKLLSEDGTGELLVLYGCFASASQACIKVRLVKRGGGAVDVYGVIYANTNRCEHPMFTSMLFSAMESNKTKLAAGKMLPLSRPTVAVPITSKLYIDYCLFINGEKCEGELEFDPKICGEDTTFIPLTLSGVVGKAKMKLFVTWRG